MTYARLADNELHVTIWDNKGAIVVDEICKCGVGLTDAELADAVAMIEHGNISADVAVFLAQQHPGET